MSDSDSSLSASVPFKMQKSEGLTRKRPLLSLNDFSSDDEDGLLSIPKHRFTPNKKPSMPDRKKDADSDSDSDDSVLNNMKIHSHNSYSAKKKSLNNFDDSDASDNDANVNANVNANAIKVQNNQIKISSNNDVRNISAPSKLKAIMTLDSDDDSDDDAAPKIQIQESQAMKKSRLAREALLHANKPIDLLDDGDNEDDYDDEIDAIPSLISKPLSQSTPYSKQSTTSNSTSTSTNHPTTVTATASITPSGPLIRIQFRASIQSAPKKHGGNILHSKSITMPFRSGTKIQQVMQSYRQRVDPQITSSANVKFILDGLPMDALKTLQQNDLEDEDMIDVTISIPANAPPSQSKSTTSSAPLPASRPSISLASAASDEYVQIITRTKNGDPSKTHSFQLKSHDPFSKLLKAYRSMHHYSSFKRIVLECKSDIVHEDQTPSELLLKAGAIVKELEMEICDEEERVKQVQRMPKGLNRTCTSGGTGAASVGVGANAVVNGSVGGVCLKIRINGNDKKCEQYSILPNDNFQKMMDYFCSMHGVLQKDCQFIFDGEPLNPKGNADQEDLEGGEVIDVKVDKTLLEKGEQNAVSVSNTASNSVGGSQVSSSTSAAETHILSLTGRLGVQITTVGEHIRVKSVYQANRKGAFFPGDRIKRINGKEIVGIAAKALPKLLKKGENEIELVRMGIDDMPQLQKKNEGASVAPLVTAQASTVTLPMDALNSLQQNDLEDEDMIDVTISIPANAPPSQSKSTTSSTPLPASRPSISLTSAASDEYVKIITRTKNGDLSKTHSFQLKSHDPF
eukprot:scaffold3745_cov202-Chaetoceros_neogracile.AAC.1